MCGDGPDWELAELAEMREDRLHEEKRELEERLADLEQKYRDLKEEYRYHIEEIHRVD